METGRRTFHPQAGQAGRQSIHELVTAAAVEMPGPADLAVVFAG